MREIGKRLNRHDIRVGDIIIIEVRSNNADRGDGEFIVKVLETFSDKTKITAKSISFNTTKRNHQEPDLSNWNLMYPGIDKITLLDKEME